MTQITSDSFGVGQQVSILVERAIEQGVAARLDKRGQQLQRIIDALVEAGLMGSYGDPSIEVTKLLRHRAREMRKTA